MGHTTSAIEGENLDRQSVRSSVARRLGLPPVDRMVDGLVEKGLLRKQEGGGRSTSYTLERPL